MANYDAIKKQTDEQAKKKIEEANKIYNDQMAATEKIYNEQIAESDKSFELTYDQANVQRKINERFAKEAVANMGLTNSGYSRNQQAQIRLVYGNAVLKTDLQKTAAANSIRQQLASHKADIEAQKAQNAFSIQNSYDQLAQESYNTQYAAEKEAAAKISAARISAANSAKNNQASEYADLKKFLRSDDYTAEQKANEILEYTLKYSDADLTYLLNIADKMPYEEFKEYNKYYFEDDEGTGGSIGNRFIDGIKKVGKKVWSNIKENVGK